MSKKHVQWFLAELPRLVEEGILPPDVSTRLRRHYEERLQGDNRHWALISFAILGGMLIGGGIILLLAHNWDNFSRPLRAIISVTPLSAAQLLAAWIRLRRSDSGAWREGVAIFWIAAIAASMALISQTYNLGGSFSDFLLTWWLLSLPVVYVLGSGVAAAIYWVGITSWVVERQGFFGSVNTEWTFLPLMLLAVPYVLLLLHYNRESRQAGLLTEVLVLAITVGMVFEIHGEVSNLTAYAGWFSTLLLAAAYWWDELPRGVQKPLLRIGALGGILVAQWLALRSPWRHTDYYWTEVVTPTRAQFLTNEVLTMLWPLAGIVLWLFCIRRGDLLASIAGAFPALTVFAYYTRHVDPWTAWLPVLFKFYLIVVGIVAVVAGVQRRILGLVNVGTATIALLIVVAFMDSDLDLTVRGLLFVVVGTGFLGVNWIMAKRMKAARIETTS